MELFKNNVGRPSNETLKKRKIILTLLVVFLLVGVIGVYYFISTSFFKVESNQKQATSNIGSSKMKVEIKPTGSRGVLVGQYKYSGWLNQDEIGGNDVFANADGKTKIDIKTTISKDQFNSLANDKKDNYVLIIRAYNTKNKEVWKSTSVNIQKSKFSEVKNSKNSVTGYSKTVELSITSQIRYFKVMIENAKNSKSKYYVQINTALYPTIEITTKGQPNSEGIVTVSKDGSYRNTIKINNPSKATVYWRWYNYDGFNDSSPSQGSCMKITGDKTFTKSLGIKDNITEKKGHLRIYNSKSACNEDDRATKSNQTTGNKQRKYYIAKETVKYQISKVYNEGVSWRRLRVDYDGIKKFIGKQKPSYCYDYSMAYGVYILSDGQKISKKINARTWSAYGATNNNADSKWELYTAIKDKIEAGIPVSLYVSDGGGDHWVLVTGYKTGLSKGLVNKNLVNLKKYLYVLDPYDLTYNSMNKEKQADDFKKQNGKYRYITWKKASDAKAY